MYSVNYKFTLTTSYCIKTTNTLTASMIRAWFKELGRDSGLLPQYTNRILTRHDQILRRKNAIGMRTSLKSRNCRACLQNLAAPTNCAALLN